MKSNKSRKYAGKERDDSKKLFENMKKIKRKNKNCMKSSNLKACTKLKISKPHKNQLK